MKLSKDYEKRGDALEEKLRRTSLEHFQRRKETEKKHPDLSGSYLINLYDLIIYL